MSLRSSRLLPPCTGAIRAIRAILIGLLLAGCGPGTPTAEKKAPPPALITVTQAQAMRFEISEHTLGSLEAANDPRIAAETAGRLLRITVRPGQAVRAGELLAETDGRDLSTQTEVDAAEIARLGALIEQQQRLLDRQHALVEKQFIARHAADETRTQLDALQRQHDAAKARARLTHSALSKTRIVAPVAGVVETQLAAPGDYLKVGDPILRLTSNAALRVHLPFPEALASRFARGQRVWLESPLLPGRSVRAEVDELRPSVSEGSRSLDLIARLVEPAPGLLGGSSVNARVVVGERDGAVAVPEQSVVLRPAGKVVYVIDNGKALQRRVEVGASQRGRVEITQGLAVGDSVALDGAGFLTDGAAVTVRTPAAEQKNTPPAAPRS